MKKKILEQYDITKKCEFCEYASKTLDDERMICKKKGVVHADYDYAVFMKYSNEEIIDVVIYKGFAKRNTAND